MRRVLSFWFSIFVAVGVIAGAVYFFGRVPVPERVPVPAEAIPSVDPDSPRFYLETLSGQLGPGYPYETPEKVDDHVRSVILALSDLSPLVDMAERSSVLGAWDANEPALYGAFLLEPSQMKELQEGKLPALWLERASGLALGPSESEGILRLTLAKGEVTLFLRADGEFLLVSHSLEGLGKMRKALDGSIERFRPLFNVEPTWPAHIEVFDGKLIAQAASLRGFTAPDKAITLELAWNSRPGSGEAAWKIEGLEEWFPTETREKITPMTWDGPAFLPEPLISAFGVSVPEGFGSLLENELSIPEWMEEAGFDRASLAGLIEGPLVGVIGGQSRLLLFNLPGVILQLPSRGAEGVRWIRGLWGNKWARFAFSPQPLPGFPAGGKLTLPFTIMAAANEEMAFAGLINEPSLGSMTPVNKIIPMGGERSILWFYADLPKAADALENLSRMAGLVEHFGVDEAPDAQELARLVGQLRSLGQVTLVIHDLGSGRGGWKAAAPAAE